MQEDVIKTEYKKLKHSEFGLFWSYMVLYIYLLCIQKPRMEKRFVGDGLFSDPKL